MEIKLGEHYQISSDKHNWILQERRLSDPKHHLAKSEEVKERFVDIGYYGKFEHLVNALLDKELRQSDINTLQELLGQLNHIENKLKVELVMKAGVE